MPKSLSIPKPYVKSGQLAVCLRDPRTGYQRTVYLGPADSTEARLEYMRVLSEWELGDRVVTPPQTAVHRKRLRADTVTVAELILRYFQGYVKLRHSDAEGNLTSHGLQIRTALRILREQAGDTAAEDFGPKALREVRRSMAESGRLGRKIVNRYTTFIVRAFRWSVSEELVPVTAYDALRTLETLKAGEFPGLRETKPVKPVPDAVVSATLPHLSTPLRGLVRLLALTGARCGEITPLRPIDIDTTGKIWRVELKQHKTAHHGKTRVLWFGPQAQDVLRPFLNRPVDSPLFSPAEAVAELLEKRRQARATPESCGNTPGSNRKTNPRKQPGKTYATSAVDNAIKTACRKAFPAPDDLTKTHRKCWEKEHRWTPHQLRHAAATRIRKAAGLEAAAVVLGHSSAVLTDATYAERDETTAINILAKIG